MINLRTAAMMALDALEEADYRDGVRSYKEEIEDLRAALGEPDQRGFAEPQEPVAWMRVESYVGDDNLWCERKIIDAHDNGGTPLYTAPPVEVEQLSALVQELDKKLAQYEQQKPVAWLLKKNGQLVLSAVDEKTARGWLGVSGDELVPVYTTPPQPVLPFAWYDPTTDTFHRSKDDAPAGAQVWPLYRGE